MGLTRDTSSRPPHRADFVDIINGPEPNKEPNKEPDVSFELYGTYYGNIVSLATEPAKQHHWIEDGTDEDFRRNVIDSDLPQLMTVFAGSGCTATGTYHCPPGSPMWRALQGAQARTFFVDLGLAERSLLQRLLDRPEMKLCEAQNIAPVPQT